MATMLCAESAKADAVTPRGKVTSDLSRHGSG